MDLVCGFDNDCVKDLFSQVLLVCCGLFIEVVSWLYCRCEDERVFCLEFWMFDINWDWYVKVVLYMMYLVLFCLMSKFFGG